MLQNCLVMFVTFILYGYIVDSINTSQYSCLIVVYTVCSCNTIVQYILRKLVVNHNNIIMKRNEQHGSKSTKNITTYRNELLNLLKKACVSGEVH